MIEGVFIHSLICAANVCLYKALRFSIEEDHVAPVFIEHVASVRPVQLKGTYSRIECEIQLLMVLGRGWGWGAKPV